MESRISIITLGVADLDRAGAFYTETLGFTASNLSTPGITFLKLNGLVLGLYPQNELIDDMGLEKGESTAANDGPKTHITLSHVCREKDEVDQILTAVAQSEGKIVTPASLAFWGGYRGYFADPDGHIWEVAYAAGWQFDEQGALVV